MEEGHLLQPYIQQLKEQGYAVIPGILSPEEADVYVERVWEWLRRLSKRIDRDDPTTWTREYGWPHSDKLGGIIHHHNVGHEQFVWDLRSTPAIYNIFAKVWDTTDLIVSFDGMCIHTPTIGKSERFSRDWEHMDHKTTDSVGIYQGFINLIDTDEEDGCLIVRPGSHAVYDEFLTTFRGDFVDDFYHFQAKHNQWYDDKGLAPIRVVAPKGSFVIWDSRCIHANSTSRLDEFRKFRMCVYITMVPRSMADINMLEKRKEFFRKGMMSSHRPHKLQQRPYFFGGDNPHWISPTLNDLGKSLI